jgi:hypothetical protein
MEEIFGWIGNYIRLYSTNETDNYLVVEETNGSDERIYTV